MQIDIPSHIEKLLFLHEALVIPGFGGFTATRTPATADYVGGTVSSPSKTLSFSENLTIDDGILISDITLTHGISTEDAQRVVEEFVEKMQSLLSQREIVTLPGVGRLYKNYVQKIQFLPDATNFNAASYGLPPLQFSPIARAREVGAEPPLPPTTEPPTPITPPSMPESTYAPERKGSRMSTALAIVFLLASLSAAIWYWQHKKAQAKIDKPDDTEQVTQTDADSKNNAKPLPPAKEESKEEAETAKPEKTPEQLLKERTESVRDQVKNSKKCTLIIATLSQKENADKLRNMLKEEGFDVYFLQRGGYQVGVQMYYTKESEIEATKATLTQLTGVKNIVVRKK